jgi:hypothetical protein
LHTFFTDDANADICFLNHCHVVTAISYASYSFASEFFHISSNFGLLLRAASTNTNGSGRRSSAKEARLRGLAGHDCGESLSIDHKHCPLSVFFLVVSNRQSHLMSAVGLKLSSDFMHLFRLRVHSCRNGNTLCCVDLVPCQHPDLDLGAPHFLNGLEDLLL